MCFSLYLQNQGGFSVHCKNEYPKGYPVYPVLHQMLVSLMEEGLTHLNEAFPAPKKSVTLDML